MPKVYFFSIVLNAVSFSCLAIYPYHNGVTIRHSLYQDGVAIRIVSIRMKLLYAIVRIRMGLPYTIVRIRMVAIRHCLHLR